jgi:putative ABC transport system ATP-binding protein
VAGQDITTMPESERDAFRRDRVGFVFQSYNLISNLTALDNVLLPYIPI